eukprot:1397868-Rhodomonas_salina.2
MLFVRDCSHGVVFRIYPIFGKDLAEFPILLEVSISVKRYTRTSAEFDCTASARQIFSYKGIWQCRASRKCAHVSGDAGNLKSNKLLTTVFNFWESTLCTPSSFRRNLALVWVAYYSEQERHGWRWFLILNKKLTGGLGGRVLSLSLCESTWTDQGLPYEKKKRKKTATDLSTVALRLSQSPPISTPSQSTFPHTSASKNLSM